MEEVRKDLRSRLRKIRKERTMARFQSMQALLSEARRLIPDKKPRVDDNGDSKVIAVPRTVADQTTSKSRAKKTVVKRGAKLSSKETISHNVSTLDSRVAAQAKVPRYSSRLLISSNFRVDDNVNLEFVPIVMCEEVKDVHPTVENEVDEYYSLFDVDGREKAISRGPMHELEETDEEIALLLEYVVLQSTNKDLERGALVDILREIFGDIYEDLILENIKDILDSTDDANADSITKYDNGMKASTMEEPAIGMATGAKSVSSDSLTTPATTTPDGEEEIIHDTLEGDDPEYLRLIDTPRKLFCPRCKLYDCNLHLKSGEVHGKPSLQLQYEAAIEMERHGRSKPILSPIDDGAPVETAYMTERTELTDLQKALCRRVFLIYEGDLDKVAVVVDAPKKLVEEFCRDFTVPSTRLLVPRKPSPDKARYYNVKSYHQKWYNDNNKPGLRDFFSPCVHDGPCEEGKCTCIDNKVFCTPACGWGPSGRNYFRGCNCKGPCQRSCTCFMSHRECDPDLCQCDTCKDPPGKPTVKQICQNDNITMRRKCATFVGRSEIPEAGFGLFCREAIPRGKFIDEYVGELISQEEAERRGRLYDLVRNTSLFGLCRDTSLDAGNKCNECRFLNHSTTPNVRPITISVKGDSRIGFFALKDIPAQTELTFNYGFNGALNSEDIPDAGEPKKRKAPATRKAKSKKAKNSAK